MANTDSKKSFQVRSDRKWYTKKIEVVANYTGQNGDVVYQDANSRGTQTQGKIIGIQKGGIEDVSIPGQTVTTAALGDKIIVYYEPDLQFTGQISTGAITDEATTSVKTAAFDIDSSTPGQHFVDAASSTDDEIRVVEDWFEDDGEPSEAGANQKKVFMFQSDAHYLGTG